MTTNGLLLDSITEKYNGNIWLFYEQTINQYDANDSIAVNNHYVFIYSSGVLTDTTFKRRTFNRDTIANTVQITCISTILTVISIQCFEMVGAAWEARIILFILTIIIR